MIIIVRSTTRLRKNMGSVILTGIAARFEISEIAIAPIAKAHKTIEFWERRINNKVMGVIIQP